MSESGSFSSIMPLSGHIAIVTGTASEAAVAFPGIRQGPLHCRAVVMTDSGMSIAIQ